MRTIRTHISEGGGIVIPVEYRNALALRVGDEVLLSLDDDQMSLYSLDTAIKRAQALVDRYVPPERSLADELIAERRAESARE